MAVDCIDDMGESLSSITASGTTIISQLLAIQEHQFAEQESTSFVKELECFSYSRQRPPSPTCQGEGGNEAPRLGYFERCSIDGRTQRDYVALSYTWTPSQSEPGANGGYMVQQGFTSQYAPSAVRDCVLARAVQYMRHVEAGHLWIDRHSVDQDDAQRKQRGVQAMHLVYSYSNHPVALLARPVRSGVELDRLHRLLAGRLIKRVTTRVVKQQRVSFKLARGVARADALEAMHLLYDMSRDDWWTRAWTFQENYRAGVRMTLLIPHDAALEGDKRRLEVFGCLAGELAIKAVVLSDHATRLCQALEMGAAGPLTHDAKAMVKHILKTMGKYTRILGRSQLMTPRIISDISGRGIKDPWDRLAITANCCWFPARLDTLALKRGGHSLSLSILALFLLNGGILDNGSKGTSPSEVLCYTTPQYLKYQTFNRFLCPHQAHSLTFTKSCRFHNVSLVAEGIKTQGQLWRLGSAIDYNHYELQPMLHPQERSFRLNEAQRQSLGGLVWGLKHKGLHILATKFNQLLDLDRSVKTEDDWKQLPFKDQYRLQMVLELAYAIKERRPIHTAVSLDLRSSSSPHAEPTALFVKNKSPVDGPEDVDALATIAFTSIVPVGTDDAEYRKDVNRHVSLEVDMREHGQSQDDVFTPHLHIRNWIMGLCFAAEAPTCDVIFPWPSEFQRDDSA